MVLQGPLLQGPMERLLRRYLAKPQDCHLRWECELEDGAVLGQLRNSMIVISYNLCLRRK